jgi:hypothetical protein
MKNKIILDTEATLSMSSRCGQAILPGEAKIIYGVGSALAFYHAGCELKGEQQSGGQRDRERGNGFRVLGTYLHQLPGVGNNGAGN